MAASTNGNGSLVDEFEEAFQTCLNILTKEEAVTTLEKDDVSVDVDHNVLKLIDLARQLEAFFLQKRFLLSALKPESVVKEDIIDLRAELARKDDLIKRHYDKISAWQTLLADLQPGGGSAGPPPAPPQAINGAGPAQQQPQPQQPQQSQHNLPQQPQAQQQQPPANSNNLPPGMQQQFQQQQQQFQQQLQQQQLQHQMQQQMAAAAAAAAGGPPPGGAASSQSGMLPQQAMFMQQMGNSRFPVQGPGAAMLQGPLANLEKATSNIGMPDGRR